MRTMSSSALRLPIEASSRSARPWAIVPAWSHFETRSSTIVHSPIVCAPSIRVSRLLCACHPICRADAGAWRSAGSGHTPIFDVRFALQNHPVPDVAVSGMAFKLRMRSTGTARFISVAKLLRMARLWRWSGCFDQTYFHKKKSTTWVHSSKRSWHESLACRKAELRP